MKVAKRGERKEQQGAYTTRWRRPAPDHATLGWGHPGPLLASLSRVYGRPWKPKSRGIRDRHRRLCGAKNTKREKLSGRQKSAGEIPSQREEIVAIVITIALDFIGIIIIITTTSTPSPPSPCHPDVTSWVESCQILRENFTGVNYSCSWCYWEEPLN
jgi:hypothetical protein